MNETQKQMVIRSAFDTALSGLTPDPFLAQRVAQGIRVKHTNASKKKTISLSAVLVNFAVTAAVFALFFSLNSLRQAKPPLPDTTGGFQPVTSPGASPSAAFTEQQNKVIAIARQCILENYAPPEEEMNALYLSLVLLPPQSPDLPERWKVSFPSSLQWFAPNTPGALGPYGTYEVVIDADTNAVRSHFWYTDHFWDHAQRVWDAGNYDFVYLQYQSLCFFYQSPQQQDHFTHLLQEQGYEVRTEENHYDKLLEMAWSSVWSLSEETHLDENHPQAQAAWQAVEETCGVSADLLKTHCYVACRHGGQTKTDDVCIGFSLPMCRQKTDSNEIDKNTALLFQESQRMGYFMVSFEKGTTQVKHIGRIYPYDPCNHHPNGPLLSDNEWNQKDYMDFVQAARQLEQAMRRMDAALTDPSYKKQVAENFLLQLGGDPNQYAPCNPDRMPQQWFTEQSVFDTAVQTRRTAFLDAKARYGEDPRFWPMEVQASLNGEYSAPREGELTQDEAIRLALNALMEQNGQESLNNLGEYKTGCRLYRVENAHRIDRWHVYIVQKDNNDAGYEVTFSVVDGTLSAPDTFQVNHILEIGNG